MVFFPEVHLIFPATHTIDRVQYGESLLTYSAMAFLIQRVELFFLINVYVYIHVISPKVRNGRQDGINGILTLTLYSIKEKYIANYVITLWRIK